MVPHSRQVPDPARELDRLEQEIRQLKIEFDRFFNGASKIPPEEPRTKVQNRFRYFRAHPLRSFAHRFRLGTLETRFNVYNELFNRRLREIEIDARQREERPSTGERSLDAVAGIELAGIEDEAAIEALYDGLYAAAGEPPDFDWFRRVLQVKIERMRQEDECELVRLRLATDGKKRKLRAEPVRRDESRERAAS